MSKKGGNARNGGNRRNRSLCRNRGHLPIRRYRSMKQQSFQKTNWDHRFCHRFCYGGELRKNRQGRGIRPMCSTALPSLDRTASRTGSEYFVLLDTHSFILQNLNFSVRCPRKLNPRLNFFLFSSFLLGWNKCRLIQHFKAKSKTINF